MKEIGQEVARRMLVLTVLLCLFSVFCVVGCVGIAKTVIFDDWRVSGC